MIYNGKEGRWIQYWIGGTGWVWFFEEGEKKAEVK
jgi:hypothetical protein